MARWKNTQVMSWGRTRRASMRLARPDCMQDLSAALADRGAGGTIAVGAGLSYGDAPLNSGGDGIMIGRLNRMLSLDEAAGEVVAEAGVTLRDLISTLLPRGFLPPAVPGTAGVTIGGAVANDIHGKNHDSAGSFGRHVQWLDLVTADGTCRRVSPTEEPGIFAATIGGIGLTGIILRVCLRLHRVPSSFVTVRELRYHSLGELMAALSEFHDSAVYSVAWLDALAGEGNLGRGLLELADPVKTGATIQDRRLEITSAIRVPFDAPRFVLNRLGGAMFNAAYFRQVPVGGRTRERGIPEFFFPLDRLRDWNRIYGRPGFYQFQCVIPDTEANQGIPAIFEALKRHRITVYLAVLKTLGDPGLGLLSFPMRGYTLALDIPNRGRARPGLSALEAVVRDHGGRVYLAKDAVLSQEGFREMYPAAETLKSVVAELSPDGTFQSDMARRLGLVDFA